MNTVDVPVQLGGGLRSADSVRFMLNLGVNRCIIGTKAAQNPEFIRELVLEFGPERIVVGVDAKNGMVAVEGWEQTSNRTAVELCLKMKEYGVRHIVYTDISRDGMLNGPNVEVTKILLKKTGLDVIASGGVSSMEDLNRLYEEGIPGAVIGKAIYEGKIVLKDAVERFDKRAWQPFLGFFAKFDCIWFYIG